MDIFNLPNNDVNNAIFYTSGSGDTWQTWYKPRNAKFIYITTIGGGGGGGSSPVSGVGTNRYGGGGGGCSSNANGLFPAIYLPDVLYIKVGTGGAGGVLGTAGSNGNISYVSVQPNNVRTNVVLQNGNSAGGGGSAGTSASVGTGGIAGVILTQVNCGLSYLGSINTSVGLVGLAGGTTNGNGTTYGSYFLNGGAGGAGVTSANATGSGGGIGGASVWPAIGGGFAGTSNPGTDGNSGYSSLPSSDTNRELPLFSTGGAGGGSSSLSSGGNGGKGGFGSGGGGGAGGVNAPGRGGDGGDGLVIITCF
jgi:hypothetical protein